MTDFEPLEISMKANMEVIVPLFLSFTFAGFAIYGMITAVRQLF